MTLQYQSTTHNNNNNYNNNNNRPANGNEPLPPPASCPNDCRVGPTAEELSDPSAFVSWGYHRKNITNGKKRRRLNDASSNTQTSIDTPNNDSFGRAIETFLSSGCCVIDEAVLPKDFVTACLDRAKRDYTHLEGLISKERDRLLYQEEHHGIVALTRQDYSEWVARDGGRIDIRYKLNEYPYNCGGLIYNSLVFPLVRALLNGQTDDETNKEEQQQQQQPVQLLYAGVMWGMPQQSESDHQHWHADGGPLFEAHHLPEGLTLPPHCINVFYPLVDLTPDNGPTEFRIGSHRTNSFSKGPEFSLLCPAGGAVLFDYRIQHRGRANTTTTTTTNNNNNNNNSSSCDGARPVLYLAYAKTYFKDHGNTRSGRCLDPSAARWTTRTLEGTALPLGKGFGNYNNNNNATTTNTTTEPHPNVDESDDSAPASSMSSSSNTTTTTTTTSCRNTNDDPPTAMTNNHETAVGERWILFQMTLELPNGTSEILRVHKGDIPVEVAQQFCFKHDLQEDFVRVLTQTIQTQIHECCKQQINNDNS